MLGTTISPYLFFWQAEEEVEIEQANPTDRPLRRDPEDAPSQLHRIRVDTYTGMGFSNLVAYFIILTAAAALWATGHRDIQTSTQAAAALEPVAGRFAGLLFALGIVGTGLLALPVLAGSAAYAVGEALRWPVGLNREPLRARGFYGVIAVATLIGLSLNFNFVHVDPIKSLVLVRRHQRRRGRTDHDSDDADGVPRQDHGRVHAERAPEGLGWLATAAMLAAAVGLFATWGK